ncbi:hypothetical protein B0H14DRAFT_3606284 [Mycena olivaceomarginata]|nr:hypothetical protein B0H14DRAFT_3606284 [Mycena olivaceomarginata]
MLLNLSLLILTAVVAPSLAKIYEDVADLPGLEYDFVIVGGGAAGNGRRHRLTENPKFSVLVLEAGVSPTDVRIWQHEGVMESIVPFFAGNLLSGPNAYDWNYTTTPQIGLNNRTTPYPRARIPRRVHCTHLLSIKSRTLDGMVYTRGSAEDYDRYAAVTGDPGWSWDSLLPYFFKVRMKNGPNRRTTHDTRGQFNPSVHSTDGIKLSSRGVPLQFGLNSGQMLGIGWLQSTIGGGKRSTSATSYLAPKFAQRKKSACFATRPSLKARGCSEGQNKEPQLLVGWNSCKANPYLPPKPRRKQSSRRGQNATEQPVIGAGWSVNSTQTVDSIRQKNTTRFNEAYEEWNRTHTGPFVNLGATFAPTHIGWMRLDADSPIFENVTDPAAGPNTPHIEMFLGTGGSAATGNFINLGGSVTLQSNNPFDPPLIALGTLEDRFRHLITAREAIKRAYRFVQAPVWRDYIIAPTTDLVQPDTEALDQFIRNGASPAGAPRFGLRRCRLGMHPMECHSLLVLHTQAAAYVVGERGADLVKERWA